MFRVFYEVVPKSVKGNHKAIWFLQPTDLMVFLVLAEHSSIRLFASVLRLQESSQRDFVRVDVVLLLYA